MEAALAPSRTAWHRDAPVNPGLGDRDDDADDGRDGKESDGVFDGDVPVIALFIGCSAPPE